MSLVRVGRTCDDSTLYEIAHAGLVVAVDVYDSGEVILLVNLEGQREIYEVTSPASSVTPLTMNDATKAKLIALKDAVLAALNKPTTFKVVAIAAAVAFVLGALVF